MVLKVLTWSGLKKHYSLLWLVLLGILQFQPHTYITVLIPLLVICGGGMLMAVAYPLRVALKNPEISWNKKSNLEPFQAYKNKKYKFISKYDYSKKSEAPEF